MERKNLIIVIMMCALVIASVLFLTLKFQDKSIPDGLVLKIKEAEISIQRAGTKNIAGFHPKYEKVELDYYYEYNECLDAFNSVSGKFSDYASIKSRSRLEKAESMLQELGIEE